MDSEMNATWQDRVKIATLPPTAGLIDFKNAAAENFASVSDAEIHRITPPTTPGRYQNKQTC